jgi:hypothetical protein
MLTNFLETINEQHEEASRVKKTVENILRKDEVLIFEEFGRVGEFEEKVKAIRKHSDQVGGELQMLDAGEWQQSVGYVLQAICGMREAVVREEVGAEEMAGLKGRIGGLRIDT